MGVEHSPKTFDELMTIVGTPMTERARLLAVKIELEKKMPASGNHYMSETTYTEPETDEERLAHAALSKRFRDIPDEVRRGEASQNAVINMKGLSKQDLPQDGVIPRGFED